MKDIQSLTLIQSQFFDCAPLLSGILKIFLAADYQFEFVTAFLYITMPPMLCVVVQDNKSLMCCIEDLLTLHCFFPSALVSSGAIPCCLPVLLALPILCFRAHSLLSCQFGPMCNLVLHNEGGFECISYKPQNCVPIRCKL